jgi:hypothetical protein
MLASLSPKTVFLFAAESLKYLLGEGFVHQQVILSAEVIYLIRSKTI